MTKEWRHLQMLKRAGRIHDPSGILNTQAGECALLCPACPHPDKNLPPGWDTVGEDKRYVVHARAVFLILMISLKIFICLVPCNGRQLPPQAEGCVQ